MSLRVTQVWDKTGCGEERQIQHPEEHENGGWRELKPGRHICNHCVDLVLRKS
jgi:hypothetical protein